MPVNALPSGAPDGSSAWLLMDVAATGGVAQTACWDVGGAGGVEQRAASEDAEQKQRRDEKRQTAHVGACGPHAARTRAARALVRVIRCCSWGIACGVSRRIIRLLFPGARKVR